MQTLTKKRRLYFDAEVEEGVAEPMASSLAVLELSEATTSGSGGGSGSSSGAAAAAAARAAALGAAWGATQWAWHPDAAYVCCGRPGHYQVCVCVCLCAAGRAASRVSKRRARFAWRHVSAVFETDRPPSTHPPTRPTPPPGPPTQGCLVWGARKTEAALAALAGDARCAKALAFTYGCHPADAALLGRRLAHTVEVLLEVPPRSRHLEDPWCRLPGAAFEVVEGGVAEHHQRRIEGLRLASRCAARGFGGGGFGGGSAFGLGSDAGADVAGKRIEEGCSGGAGASTGSGGGGGSLAAAVAAAAALKRCGGSAAGALLRGEPESFWAGCRARELSSSGCSSSDADSLAVGAATAGAAAAAGVGTQQPQLSAAPSVLSCPSAVSSSFAASVAAGGAGGLSRQDTGASTPTFGSGALFAASCGAAAAGGASRRNSRCVSEPPPSPFAAMSAHEIWDDEQLVIVAGGGW